MSPGSISASSRRFRLWCSSPSKRGGGLAGVRLAGQIAANHFFIRHGAGIGPARPTGKSPAGCSAATRWCCSPRAPRATAPRAAVPSSSLVGAVHHALGTDSAYPCHRAAELACSAPAAYRGPRRVPARHYGAPRPASCRAGMGTRRRTGPADLAAAVLTPGAVEYRDRWAPRPPITMSGIARRSRAAAIGGRTRPRAAGAATRRPRRRR